jgi:DNA modification methylase
MNEIITGDAQRVLENFPENFFDMCITSPPYDNLRTYNGTLDADFPFEEIATQLFRTMKIGGVVIWVVGDAVIKKSETGTSFKQALFFISLGFLLHDTMIYEKNGPSFPARRNGNRYSQIFEYMFILSKKQPPKTTHLLCDKPNRWEGYTTFGKASYRNKEGELIKREIKPIPAFSPRYNIWKYNTGFGYSTKDKFAFEHPAIFPEQLVEDHILSWSEKEDIILDPFSGSGTTCKIAKKLERNFIGIEIVPEYAELSRKRIAEA